MRLLTLISTGSRYETGVVLDTKTLPNADSTGVVLRATGGVLALTLSSVFSLNLPCQETFSFSGTVSVQKLKSVSRISQSAIIGYMPQQEDIGELWYLRTIGTCKLVVIL
jgi:hypothetical protein